uniref:Lipoxygenase n=1 Tax=Kalanchoe fedtschenkoi TaxID=63787 RepID=A0A7N0ZWW6_KALFE
MATLCLDVSLFIAPHHQLRRQSEKKLLVLGPKRSCVGRRRRLSNVSMKSKNRFNNIVAVATREDLMRAAVSAANNGVSKFNVKATVTIKNKLKPDLSERLVRSLDGIGDLFGKNVIIELVSVDVDPKTKSAKISSEGRIKEWFNKSGEKVSYTVEFTVDANFGLPGVLLVTNNHQQEFFLENVTVEGFHCGPIHFPCNSWVQSHKHHPQKRVFFFNKPYLPGETPEGLKALREEELRELRGTGTGERKLSDRIYDFDVYNDLGNPDKGFDYIRPTLGGGEIKYPRRCRTGRPPCVTDESCESRLEKPLPMYVPRDEQFEEPKRRTFLFGRFKGLLRNIVPITIGRLAPNNIDIKGFSEFDKLYKRCIIRDSSLKDIFPFRKTPVEETGPGLFKFDLPKIVTKDKFGWFRDDEFARQAIAGVNPVSIERVEVFPPVSKLDPQTYGPSVNSALREDHILPFLNGLSVQQALDGNKLFMLDYHDIYLPFVDRINALDGHKTYATRTIFFLSDADTLKPIAIELSLSPGAPSSRAKRVVTPASDATSNWIWQMAKVHVAANDAGAHQLVYHWLRTHACVEPFIIAAHRQLSAMHPVYKLLDPHMRYTLEINALARQSLISNTGVIDTCFTPGRYHMEISAAAYNDWRFDMDELPSDLIRRGMAVDDPAEPHGLKLLIEDYPFANDGLLVWSAIENWVKTYVNHYYHDPATVLNDSELQAWYCEAVSVGHADIKDAEWWPKLDSPENLSKVLTILIWLASALHAALNFGQYPYGGYLPNRPPLMRRLIPDENDAEYANFVADPEKYFLMSLPSKLQISKYMAVVDSLSTHSPDEEYLGQRPHAATWTGDKEMVEAFFKFAADVSRVEKEIEKRNLDPSLRNRCGAGVLPYELLAPISEPGVTCRGIPNSSSI